MALEGQIRKERKEQLYRKQIEALEFMLSWTIGTVLFIVGIVIIGGAIWFIGKMQGRW